MKKNEMLILSLVSLALVASFLEYELLELCLLFLLSFILLYKFFKVWKLRRELYCSLSCSAPISCSSVSRSVPLVSNRGMVFKVFSVDPDKEIEKIL